MNENAKEYNKKCRNNNDQDKTQCIISFKNQASYDQHKVLMGWFSDDVILAIFDQLIGSNQNNRT